MGLIGKILDWTAKKVQDSTGETERRELLAALKAIAAEFKQKVSEAISSLNQIIDKFNQAIQKLNQIRNADVKENIDVLSKFLGKFGNCRPSGDYEQEADKLPAMFPQKEMDDIKNYIANVDWSRDDVFWNTFLLSPVGMKLKTRGQNLSMREHINELRFLMEQTLQELKIRQLSVSQETRVCALYFRNVVFISNFIKNKILPELELVEAFFQAEKIKDEILCGHSLKQIHFTYDIRQIIGTPYEKHYCFIRNAFLFYIISCKIYDTPVLSRLLEDRTTMADIQQLEEEYHVLEVQADTLSQNMFASRS